MDFFPNQAALDGFLQVGLRNRIGKLGGTGSPILHVDGSPVRLECSPMILQNKSWRSQLSP